MSYASIKHAAFSMLLALLLFVTSNEIGAANNIKYREVAIYKEDYNLSFFPEYPAIIGETTTLRLRTFVPALKVTLYSDREEEIPMTFRNGYWWGRFRIPDDYKEGGHFFTVWIKAVRFDPRGLRPGWSKSVIWYKAFRRSEEAYVPLPPELALGTEEELPLPVTGEAVEIEVVSPEVSPLLIKGSQSITFKSRSLEGSKEGYAPGTVQTREETLRINISGRAADTDIEASLYRTTATGITQIGEREEEISILLRRGSTELYLGDFTADLTETEFTRLNNVLSGARLKGDYEKMGFTALYSSPKGIAQRIRRYGDGTQGPYSLTSKKIVVDSERVYVDSVLQKRGDDYEIDYAAGSLTFKDKIIHPLSIVEISFDESETIYQHSTYALRPTFRPNPNLKLGVTYINDSDSLQGVTAVEEGSPAPQSHYVVGVDGSYVSEKISVGSEIAYSDRNLDIFSGSGTQEAGKAAKIDISSQFGIFGIRGSLKRVGPKFQSIADPDPKQDITEYGGLLSFRPGSLFGAQGGYIYNKYTQDQVIYENSYRSAKASLTPERLPSLEYSFSETDESNDPVTGTEIKRVITRNSAETNYQFGFFNTSLRGTLEKWLRRYPSEEATDYKKLNLGLATIGLEEISFTSNVELEDRREPSGLEPYRRTYDLRLSATPSKKYFVSSSVQIIDDSEEGHTNVTDLAYRVQPSEIFKTDGKYTIGSLKEDFYSSPGSEEAVSKQAGSFSFDFRPYHYLRLRYLYKPSFTRIERTQTLGYKNEQQQSEINIIPSKQMLLGLIYKLGRRFNVYKNDYPDYKVKDKSEDTDSTLYTLKMAPLQILSIELNHLQENSFSETRQSSQEPYTYLAGCGTARKFDAIAKTSLSEKFSIDSRYTFQKTDQGSGESSSNVVDTKSHTASLKGIWNYSETWTFSLSGAYSRATDYILSQVTYTYSPGFGIIYRRGEKLRVDFNCTYSKSYAGAETEKTNYSLMARYALSDFVNVNLLGEQEISSDPDYRLTDITGNVEISL